MEDKLQAVLTSLYVEVSSHLPGTQRTEGRGMSQGPSGLRGEISFAGNRTAFHRSSSA
jgi:hypothetical protein